MKRAELVFTDHGNGWVTAEWSGPPTATIVIPRHCEQVKGLFQSLRVYRLRPIGEEFYFDGLIYARTDGWRVFSWAYHRAAFLLCRLRGAALRTLYSAAYYDCGIRTFEQAEMMSLRGFLRALWKSTEA